MAGVKHGASVTCGQLFNNNQQYKHQATMKLLVVSTAVLFAVVCTVTAEPPRYRSAYAAPAPAPAPVPEKVEAAPYPPSGWRPAGRAFNLPKQAPKDATMPPAPQDKYGPPPAVVEYGPPTTEQTTTEQPTTTEAFETTTDQPQGREVEEEEEEDEPEGSNAVSTAVAQEQRLGSGVYYVFLPDGRLQRVAYTNQPGQQYFQQLNAAPQPINAGYLAVQYQDVQPIQAPIYTFGPTQQLVRVVRK